MRVVIDTNVLVSAVLKENSLPAAAVRLVARRDTLLKSDLTEWELFDVLGRPKVAGLIPDRSRQWMERLILSAEPIGIAEIIQACRDRDDDKFLELAVSGRADAIISGDADLLVLNPFRDIAILTPANFLESIGRR